MSTFNVHEAKTRLSELLARVEAGEEVVLARAGRPVARLVRIRPSGEARKPGSARGKVKLSADFDAPLPADLMKAFR